jgi:polyhydroxyalkanoate synthesis regulator protein
MTQAFGGIGAFGPLEEQVRRNMELFERTFSMFKPFTAPRRTEAPGPAEKPAEDDAKSADDMDTLRRQMKEMQEKLDRMSKEQDKT